MDIIDWIIIILTIAGLILGFMKGLIGQVSTICGVVLGIIACNMFGAWATRVLVEIVPEAANWPEPQYTTSIIANIVLFLLVFLGIKIAGAMFKSVVSTLHLGIIDKIAGSLFCVFKYLLVVSIVLNIWYMVSPDSSMFTKQHAFNNEPFRLTMKIAPSLLGVESLPQSLDDISKTIDDKDK